MKKILVTNLIAISTLFAVETTESTTPVNSVTQENQAVTVTDATATKKPAKEKKKGKTTGQLRYYYMLEDNKETFSKDGLNDYYGNAIGGYLKYETPSWAGFKAAVAAYSTNFLADNVSKTSTEPAANNLNSRYVIGLMNLSDADDNSVTNIGEAYISYELSKTKATFGRMKLNTPFINPQDGRIIPTLEQGVWLDTKDLKDFQFQLGYINRFWDRSTPEWKDVEDSLGYFYGQGNAPIAGTSATKSNYSNNTKSNGVFIGSALYQSKEGPLEGVKLEVWDYYVENIFNTAYVEGNYNKKFGSFKSLVGGQYIAQQEVGDGGNGEDNGTNPTNAQKAKSYMRDGEKSQTYGAKLGFGYLDTLLTIAGTTTTDEGRFLFPREWGREPIFTFQKRERTDGSGNTTAWLVTLDQDFKAVGLIGFSVKLGYGQYYKEDPKNWVLNKYGVPSYGHLDVDIFYKFQGDLQGLELEYLYAQKDAIGPTYEEANSNFVFTKNGMVVHNFIVNYKF